MNKLKKVVIILIILIIAIVLYTIIINQYIKSSTNSNIVKDGYAHDIEAILILGCRVMPNGELSYMLKDRLDKGIELYKNNVAPKIIVSGDHGQTNYDEVNTMKNYLIDNEIPSEDIFMDHAGFSTYDSLYRAKEIFGANKIIVVTQTYHLYRAIYVGKSLGIETYGTPAVEIDYYGQFSRDIREFIARNKEFIKCIIKPKPKYLGEKISLAGNGDVTNDKYNN